MTNRISRSLLSTATITLLILIFLGATGCSSAPKPSKNANSMTIAFGSCSHQWEAQPIWTQVLKNQPDVWIWLGDIIYADTDNMSKMKADYDAQKANTDYQALTAATKVIGVWDDHDYGSNNAGKEYTQKDSSKQLLFDFLNIPDSSEARNRPGAYNAHTLQEGNLKVKTILLDVRYFRDTIGSKSGTILGNRQWQWLMQELTDSDADVHIIGGGIQFLPQDHRFEKWHNFPVERERLLQIIDMLDVKNPILLSGDRHIAEFSLDILPNKDLPILEITSSGLTHSYTGFTEEKNELRIGEAYPEKNFGTLTIEKRGQTVIFDATIRSDKNKVVAKVKNTQLKGLITKRNNLIRTKGE